MRLIQLPRRSRNAGCPSVCCEDAVMRWRS